MQIQTTLFCGVIEILEKSICLLNMAQYRYRYWHKSLVVNMLISS